MVKKRAKIEDRFLKKGARTHLIGKFSEIAPSLFAPLKGSLFAAEIKNG
jgi:hypothetical protein